MYHNLTITCASRIPHKSNQTNNTNLGDEEEPVEPSQPVTTDLDKANYVKGNQSHDYSNDSLNCEICDQLKDKIRDGRDPVKRI